MAPNDEERGPAVSIGIPVRNGENFLRETLDALLALEFKDLEIVVSDNCSEDSTAEILSDYGRRDRRIRYFRQPDLIPALDNFRFVLEKSTGEYFCWNAHDDIRSPQSISMLVEVLRDPEVACAMTDVVNLSEESGSVKVDYLEAIRLENVKRDWVSVRRKFFEVPTTNLFHCFYGLIRREVAQKCPLELICGQAANIEIPFLATVSLMGRIVSVEHKGFQYRRHAASLYHQEMAKEPKDAARSRRTTIRKLVLKIIFGSTLPAAEKVTLIALLLSGEVSERRTRIQTALGQAAKKTLKKRKSLMKKISLRRTLRRIKSVVMGQCSRPSNPRLSKQDRELRKKERLNERRRAKGVLNFEADLDAPDIGFLVERERERARLEAGGWIFAQPKRLKLINDRRITTILDCGANAGQYVADLEKAGWAGKVYSFEPLSDAYEKLRAKAEASEQWRTFHFALGERNEESTIQIAGNSYSSSLLQFSTDFKELRPDASPVGSETVTIRRLDDVVKEEGLDFDGPVMLKLDVQGFELSVLRGALETLPRVSMLQCELALIPSYEGGATFVEVREFLRARGFVLAHLIDGHVNHETGELREMDGIFLNTRLAPVDGS